MKDYRDRPWLARKYVDAKLWFAKFQRQTHGLGIILIIFIVIIMASFIIPFFDPVNQTEHLQVCTKGCLWNA